MAVVGYKREIMRTYKIMSALMPSGLFISLLNENHWHHMHMAGFFGLFFCKHSLLLDSGYIFLYKKILIM